MKGSYDNICVKGILSVVPEQIIENMDFVKELADRRVKKQLALTGIERRRACAEGQTAGDLCTAAADRLLEKLQWDRNEIDALVYVTQSPDFSRPSSAFLIQKRLGIGRECSAFDVNLGCSGYVAGLQILSGLLHNTGGRGLLLAGESHVRESGGIDSSSLLVGDAGSATAVKICPGNRMLYRQQSDGEGFYQIYKSFNQPAFMDGNGVLLFTLNDVVKSIVEFRDIFGVKEEEIDYYVLHQAQKMILEGVAKGAGIDQEKVLSSCRDFGNTSSASVPVTLCVERDKYKDREKITAYMCGFGIGLSWGSVLMDLETSCIYPMEESNIIYSDRKESGK